MKRLAVVVVVLLGLIPFSQVRAEEDATRWDPAQEVEIGKQASAEIEAEFSLVRDEELLERLEEIVQAIASVSERPDVKYVCKILETDEVNAYSVPGGTLLPNGEVEPGSFIYVTEGLFDFVRSEHELAAILAHEIAHEAHYHALRQLEEYSRHSTDSLLAALLGVWLSKGDPSTAGAAYLAGELLQAARTHSYTITLEKEADLERLTY